MPERIEGFTHYITFPSSIQRARLEELLKKQGVKFRAEKGKVYTTRASGLAHDVLRSLGAKEHPLRRKKNQIILPAVQCSYSRGCNFKTADMDDLAEHLRGHFSGYPQREEGGTIEREEGGTIQREGTIEVQVLDPEEEKEMVQTTESQERGTTSGGYRRGKFTERDLIRLQRMMEEGLSEREIAKQLGRRVKSVQKWIEKISEDPQLVPEQNGLRPSKTPKISPNGPVTHTYTVLGLFKRANRQMEELKGTLAELTEILGPFLESQEKLLDRPVNRDWR